MNSMNCSNDDTFGPVVQGCRDDFDFTQKFERISFTALPAAIFILLAAARVRYLATKPRLILGIPFQTVKIATITIYTALQLSLLILISNGNAAAVKSWSIAGTALTLTAGLVMMVLSFFEHSRSPRSSALLNIYILLTLVLDIIQVRTLWLQISSQLETTFARVYTASITVKLFVLLFEARGKARWITWDQSEHSPEETTGIYGLSIYYWLKQIFIRGYRTILHLDDLYSLDRALTAEDSTFKLMQKFKLYNVHQKHALLKSLLRAFWWPFLLPIGPQVTLVAFTYAQSFFLQALINYLDEPKESRGKNYQYGLMVACALIYAGTMISTSYFGYFTNRLCSMIRPCLCAAIYKKSTEVKVSTSSESTSLTLMSTDVEHIEQGFKRVHRIWAGLLQVGVGCWLLYQKLGIAFVTPLVVILITFVILSPVLMVVGKHQTLWLEKTQKRVAHTANAISNMKIFKMLGISDEVAEQIHDLRREEIRAASKFRVIMLITVTMGFAPECLSPALTLAFTFQTLDVATIFVSLSFIFFLSSPLVTFSQDLTFCLSALTSLNRIQEFLAAAPRDDFRSSTNLSVSLPTHDDTISTSRQLPTEIFSSDWTSQAFEISELVTMPRTSLREESSKDPAFNITGGYFGWEENKNILSNINVQFPSGKLSMVVGPIASGKTTLCQALLGEIPFASGQIQMRSQAQSVGFCSQSPFLSDASLKDNIVGHSLFDQHKYDAVISATMLVSDIARLPSGDDTKIGSNGIILSGGQKQRVSLARALYLESDVLILDDILSGLDATTETEVFKRVLGKNGLARQRGTTIILATHSIRHLPVADHIVALDKNGSVVEQGSYDFCIKNGKYVSDLAIKDAGEENQENAKVDEQDSDDFRPSSRDAQLGLQEQDLSRQVGDWTLYWHYFSSTTIRYSVFMLILSLLFGFCGNFSTIWISYWSQDSFRQTWSFYVGIYNLLRTLDLIAIFCGVGILFFGMVVSSGLNLHEQAITTIAKAPLRVLTDRDVGSITGLFSQDMTLIDTELPLALINTSFLIFNLIGNAFVAAVPSPYLAISYPVILLVLFAVQIFYLRTSRQLRLLDLEAKGPLYNHFINTSGGLATLRAFGWIGREIAYNNELINASQRPAYLLSMVQEWLSAILFLIVGIIATMITVLATTLNTGSSITAASLVTIMTLAGTMSTLMYSYTSLETSIGAVSRLRQFSRDVKPEEEYIDQVQLPAEWPHRGSIELRSVSASYKPEEIENDLDGLPRLVLKDVSVTIQAGEKIAICGRTGSGKSSLILLLLRLLDPLPSSSENILIDGIPTHHILRSDLRSRIITLPQDAVFLPGNSTIKANIDPSNAATDEQCLSAFDKVHLSEFVQSRGGLHAPMSANDLSVGQQQLFSLARAVLKKQVKEEASGSNGGVLLMDELNSKLDRNTDLLTQEIIEQEFTAYTVVMVVHRLGIVMEMCDRVVVLDQGKIVEEGSPRGLVEKDGSWFSALWREG